MRKLVAGTFLTLDGVMQGPGGPDEDRDGGFEQGGWAVKYRDEMMGNLIDEFDRWVFPVSVGPGKRLFGDGTVPGAFRLADTKVSTTGVVLHRYERAGKLEHGTFEVDKEGRTAALWEDKP